MNINLLIDDLINTFSLLNENEQSIVRDEALHNDFSTLIKHHVIRLLSSVTFQSSCFVKNPRNTLEGAGFDKQNE